MVLKITGIAAGVIILLVIAVGVGAYFGVIPNPFLRFFLNPPEHSARYYPDDTLAYAWVTLYPTGGQQEQMLDIWERFNGFRAFRERLDDLYDGFEEETSVDFKQDILPWAGPDFSFGVIELTGDDEAILAATIGVRDKNAAAFSLDTWLDYLEDTQNADFDSSSYRDVDTWVDENTGQAYALSQDMLLFVFSEDDPEDVLEEMLDLANGDNERSLANDANFKEARAVLTDRRFGSVYVNNDAAIDAASEFLGELNEEVNTFSDWWDSDWVSASAQWVERGVVLETVWSDDEDYGSDTGLQNPAELLPDTVMGFVALGDDYEMDRWREVWGKETVGDLAPELNDLLKDIDADIPEVVKADDDFSKVLDLAILSVYDATGIDLETDFFDYVGGWTIMAVNEFDFERVEEDPLDNPIDAVLMFQHHPDREKELTDTMDKAVDLLEENFYLDADPANVGADSQARIFDLGGAISEYTPGYVLHDGYLTLGTTEDSLATIVSVQRGEADTLASVAEYKRAVNHLPEERLVLAWVNLQGIVAQLDADEIELTRGEYRMLRESIGTSATSVYDAGDYFRFNFVLTLFPE